ncbi:MAG: aminopeptidase P family protein [Ruminococcaceae bacterium]|nr:aminopeptidase P family protein [Oscillospiraceae bacterium]
MTNLEKIRSAFTSRGLDAVIIFDERNQRYISDFAFSDGLLFITKDRAELITDFRYYEMAGKKADKAFNITMPDNRIEFIQSAISGSGVKTIGFEGNYVSYERYSKLCESFSDTEFVNIGNMIEEIRQIKTSEEISLMQQAQDIADKAYAHILNVLTPNMTEIDVATELEYAMRKNGAESAAFETIAVSGDASALPHGTPRNVKLKRGFLTMDFGAKVDRYCSDMTRTVVIGRADEEIKKLYNTVLKAQLAALEFLEVGKDCGEADKVARDIIDSHPEYKGTFGHSLGHSIGLLVHETPSLSRRAFGHKMRPGEIYTVEPGIYLFGKYGCRIEDMVAIKEKGVHNFTHSTKDLIEIL